MDSKRLFAAGLLGLFIASATSTFTAEKVSAQGLRGRLRDRLEGVNPNNPNPQQNSTQQGNPQQQMSGQQPYAGQQMPVQMPNTGQPMPGQMGYPPQQQLGGQASTGGYDVSEVTLQTQPGPGGSQMVVTPRGMVVPLPGQGVNSNVVQVYMGGQGGFWYIDKNGQQVDLTPAVHAFQQMGTQAQQSAVPQYAPQPQVVNNYNAPQQQGGGSGSGAGALGTAAAAGMGAMAGSAIANSMYQNQVPYGTPIHYGAGAVPYYNQGGKPVYINASNNTAEFNQINNQHMTAMQQQQDWYKAQQVAQSSNWKNWQQTAATNPFVNSAYQSGSQVSPYAAAAADQYHNNNVQQQHEEQAAAADHYHNNNVQQQHDQQAAAADHYHNNNVQQQHDQQAAAADHYHNNNAAAAAASGESHGRFGRGGAEGQGGGRFGKGAAGEESGGRFSKAAGGAESGGRLGEKAAGRSRGRLRGER